MILHKRDSDELIDEIFDSAKDNKWGDDMGNFGFFTDDRLAWQVEFEKLSKVDFDRLGVEKDKLYDVLEKLHDWRVIRWCD